MASATGVGPQVAEVARAERYRTSRVRLPASLACSIARRAASSASAFRSAVQCTRVKSLHARASPSWYPSILKHRDGLLHLVDDLFRAAFALGRVVVIQARQVDRRPQCSLVQGLRLFPSLL